MDVLLTSLMKGTLLPSALIWIITQPSGAEKIPPGYIEKTTECRVKADLASKWAVKEQLTRQYSYVAMGVDMQKTSTLLNDIYTDLYIIEGERGEVETQHETKQIEGAKFKPQETAIKYHAIFKPPSGNNKTIRSVLTLGMAGIGKSFAIMKYMLDWAEDKSHEDIFFMFPLSFRELNLREEETYSLEGLIHSFFPAMRKSEIKDYNKYPILIVLDGFDECRLGLVFDESNRLTDVTEETSVKVLLANLIQGNLLPNAQIWITSRPAASNVIPADKVDRVTEVRGFNDEQKEEYFKKRFEDKDLAEKVLSHVKKSRTLYIMCHIPVFCWLTSKVLEDFVERKEEGKMPSTLTDLFIHFLLLQCRQANVKYGTGEESGKSEDPEIDPCWNSRNRDTVVTLGKLAFEGLEKGVLVFTEETLAENGVDIKKASVFSGIFTQIKREGPGLHEQKLFCFAHLSIQEFMASLFVFHTFNDRSENLLTEPPSTIEDLPASDFYKTAVDKALSSKNGYWDLFLRFLLGLSLETNQVLLQELLKKTENNKETNEATISYIKEKIREEKSDADQNFNLFHCLNELNDQTLVDEAKMYLSSKTTKFEDFSTSQWSALNFVLLTSGENLDEFELKKYRKSEQVLLGLMPVVKVAKTALLSWCELTEESCHALKSSVYSFASCNLTKLDLSHNDLLDAGVKHLAEGLKSSHCKLEVLKLSGCQVTEEGCSSLASALRSNTASSLKELDLSYNHPGAKGAAMLSALVRDPKMSLRKLCLDRCGMHCLQSGIKKYEKEKQQTKEDMRSRILIEHDRKLREQEPETELYEIDESKSKEDKVPSWDALFCDSEKEEVKTVLMKGVPGVGKTQQTIRHMVDWAKGRSNTNKDFIVPLHFHELNSNKVQSLKDLLQSSLYPKKIPGVVVYDKSKILFVLDGLEQCELPLRFEENKNLTDVEEPACMDVLLTSLIKGTLLPSALIWIITQPSGAEKIPPGYIQKVTECRETSVRRKKLISALKKRFRETIKDGDLTHPNQTNTEHIMREEKSHETSGEEKNKSPGTKPVIQVNAVSEIFKERSGNKPRNVLTTGVAGIGKSFHVDRLIKEWADEDEVAAFFPLNLCELKLRREEKVSLFGLLNHFFNETKEIIISNYEKLRVLFVLDGLDAFKPALNLNDEEKVTDVREPAPVNVLLTSLIRGTLLPSAQVWITSRPSAVHQLPDTCVNRRTEIRHKPDLASKWAVQSQLKRQFTHVAMGVDIQKTSTLLNDVYTDLYIIEGERGEVETHHDTKQIEGANFKPQETAIKYHAIFKPPSGNNKTIRSVLTTGMAGIGKSFTTMKYMLDWAEDKSHEDIFFMFPLSFRELNLREEETYSLEGLIHSFFPAMRKSEIKDYDKYSILIVLDGFDECRLGLDFDESNRLTDVTKETSVKVLLANLIQGNLLPNAQIWITSQPAACNVIPVDKVDRLTEVRGFNDEQREEYFKNRFEDKDLAEKVLSHVKKSRTLYNLCHIPVFCWLTSKVLEDFVERKEEGKMPSTLTDLFIHFLLLQCRQSNVKYGTGEASGKSEDPVTDSCWNSRNRDTVVTLGKLAFEGLEKGVLVFTEETLAENGVDIKKAAVFSGVFTQIKREGPGLNEQKLFRFVHLSIQEFMASLFVFHTFNDRSENLLTEPPSTIKDLPASDFYKTAVDKALSSKNGFWDLFLRFLLGLSLETNQVLLQELLEKTENNKETNKATIRYIKEKIREEKSDADQYINLFHCLNELNDQTLVDEVQMYLSSKTTKFEDFSTSQWLALNFVLLTSGENLDEFELKKYRKSEQVLLGLMPVVKVAKTALLSWCELTEESCHALKSSIYSFASCNFSKLDLSHNDLLDAGVKHLAEGLKSPRCKLEVLK
ncbi:uncharacterized protein LOC141798840 [Halichoeres trimaculatus]|uniref:uncharacterized protein LOC141798840 n=1 Tax=Halichoeres trimaculatus TaxID=147232 RepID=UPI003D9DCE01